MGDSIEIPDTVVSRSDIGQASNFPQTGSWSMVDLIVKPINVTVGILQRYSAGRVDIYTAVVGQALCKGFRLGTVGRKRIDEALSSLAAMSSLGDALYFGFGVENLVRSLAKTEEGAVCLALCAALRDCYHEDVAVEVLLELARLTAVPAKYMPSSFEWKALLNACSGVLSTTTFSLRAEQLMSLSQQRERLGAFGALEARPSTLRSCSSPRSLAKALFGVARVTREELRAVTIIGGADAGWLAALAEWLFGCTVKVTSDDGFPLYQNVQEGEEVQLHFIFTAPWENASHKSQELELQGKTYILENVSQLFQEEGRHFDAHVVSGRVRWEHALSMAFMADFQKLMGMSNTLGKLIGSAARIFKAVAHSDQRIPLKYRSACASYCNSSFGAGFVQNTLAWFPELLRLQNDAGKAAGMNLEVAKASYETGIQNLRTTCQCTTCQSSYTGFDFSTSSGGDRGNNDGAASDLQPDEGDSPSSDRNSDTEEEMDWDPDRFCLVVLAETIICVSRCLAHLNVAHDLYPMRSGLEAAYGRQLNLRRSSNLGRHAIEEMGPIVFCMDFDNSFSWKVEEDLAEVRLFQALEIFTGRSPSRGTWGVSAQCANGICAFLAILQEVSDQNEAVGRVNVLPGRIDLEGKSYTTLEDERLRHPRGNDFSSVLAQMPGPYNDQVRLRIKEGPNSLQCLLEVRHSQDKYGPPPILVGPAKIASMLASTRGWVTCKQLGKCKKVMNNQLGGQDGEIAHGEIYLTYINTSSTIQAIVALAAASSLEENCSLYLVDKQCLDCCVKAAVGIDRPEERNRFCFLRYIS